MEQKETSPPPAPADATTTAIDATTTTTAAAPAAAGAAEDLKEKMALDQTVEFPTPSAAPPPPNRDEELEDEKNTKNEKDEKEDAMEEAGEEKKEKDGDDDENDDDENDENDEEEEINVEDWPVSDDFLLIKCVENGCALESLAMRNSIVNFSKEYNLEEIERRWRGILFGEKSAYEVAKRLREYME